MTASTTTTNNVTKVIFLRLLAGQPLVGVRHSSSASPVAGPMVTSLKRDASTQAQQQVALDLGDNKLAYYDSFRSSDLEIIKCLPGEMQRKPSPDKLLFGHNFTDHMFRCDWDKESGGWATPLISKLHNFDIHPAAKVLHYAIEAFEGAKAFRGHDNKIRFFRLDQNIKRLLNSARRLALPEFDGRELMDCIHKLVAIDQDWIPSVQGNQLTSLYIRPTMLGVEPSLGVASSKKAILYVLLSPVGPYFKTGFKPVSLYADPSFVRAWGGGAGNSKLGSNYAPTIAVQRDAEKLGLQQVLWLYGDDMKLTEVGTMNIFISYRNTQTNKIHLVTPPLNDGLILPGITRSSILDLARQWSDVVCEERYVTIKEIESLIHENKLLEMFGSGTACIVCPISLIHLKSGHKLRIPYFDITQITDNKQNGTAHPATSQQLTAPLRSISSATTLSSSSSSSSSSQTTKTTTNSDLSLVQCTGNQLLKEDRYILTKRILKAITDIQYGRVNHPWANELRY